MLFPQKLMWETFRFGVAPLSLMFPSSQSWPAFLFQCPSSLPGLTCHTFDIFGSQDLLIWSDTQVPLSTMLITGCLKTGPAGIIA